LFVMIDGAVTDELGGRRPLEFFDQVLG